MISAVLSVVLAFVAWFGAPIAVPVFALALGANAIVKERRLEERRPLQVALGSFGVLVGGAATLFVLFKLYV